MWSDDLYHALKTIVLGPPKSDIDGSQPLCDLIQDLREQSGLPPLPDAPLDGIRLYFDDVSPNFLLFGVVVFGALHSQ